MLRVKFCFLALAVISGLSIGGAAYGAQGGGMDAAVKLYLGGNYDDALLQFKSLEKADPTNAKVHYYTALCLLRTEKEKDALEEYKLALKNCKDKDFEDILKARLARLESHFGKSAPLLSPELATKAHGPVKKVIYFSTNWCPTCKGFTPVWDSVSGQYKKVSFEHLNAEDPSCWNEVKKYRPKGYPTLVYVDDKGALIKSGPDAPSVEGFKKTLESFGAK